MPARRVEIRLWQRPFMSPTVGLRLLMGGTLTTSIAVGSDLSVRVVVDISTHCWVLKEQTFFPGKIIRSIRISRDTAGFGLVGPVIQV